MDGEQNCKVLRDRKATKQEKPPEWGNRNYLWRRVPEAVGQPLGIWLKSWEARGDTGMVLAARLRDPDCMLRKGTRGDGILR